MGRFDGKVVLITGGARGQGRSTLAFAREGAEIAVTDIAKQVETVPYGMSSEADLAETVAQVEALDQRCLSFIADARDTAAMNAPMESTISEFGRIDVLSPTTACCRSLGRRHVLRGVGRRHLLRPDRRVQVHPGCDAAHGGGKAAPSSPRRPWPGVPACPRWLTTAPPMGRHRPDQVGRPRGGGRRRHGNGGCPTNLDSDMIHNEAFYALFAPGTENPTREQVTPGFAPLNAIPIPGSKRSTFRTQCSPGFTRGPLHHRGSTACQRHWNGSTPHDQNAAPGHRRAGVAIRLRSPGKRRFSGAGAKLFAASPFPDHFDS